MGKIVRQGVEYGGSSNSADCIKYNETKSVKEAIDEIKASSSSDPTAASVTFDNTDTGLNATNVQDAVTEVNGKLGNTYRLNIPVLPKFGDVYTSDFILEVFNKVAILKLSTLCNLSTGLQLVCSSGSIPEEYRPEQNVSITTVGNNSGTIIRYLINVQPDGGVSVYNYGTYSGAENISDEIIYICSNVK